MTHPPTNTGPDPERTPTQPRPRRRGPRGDLDRAGLVAAATRVVDTQGLTGLTLRKVATEAGVTPTALYTYFVDMADVANAVGDAFLGSLGLPGILTGPGTPRVRLRAVLDRAHSALMDRPGMLALIASRPLAGPHSFAFNEALLRTLTEAGLPPERVRAGAYVLTCFLLGHLATTAPHESGAALERAREGLDPADYPLSFAPVPIDDPLPGAELLLDGILNAR
ncbi:TetR/AcrR family transcriptional regulator [Ammonicoccus fulvus]|uniref:TetR/AcrR family transcriptional regulator n=1 Tax=Ammonicoccus fulvus TaxID=3138240 RepID=A0ABZ3FN58_9ACTN